MASSVAPATMAGKLCLVTGATSGIGHATARGLAERGAQVVLVARDRGRAEATVAEIERASGRRDASFLLCDLASQRQIRELAATFCERFERLDVLVNNAGAFFLRRRETEDGIERTFAVNHLAYVLLTRLLLERLRESAPARIVNVASDAHENASLHFGDLGLRRGYTGMKAYGQSKLANVMFSYELACRLEGSGVTVNVLHPGFVATNIGADSIPLLGRWLKRVINLRALDVEAGARTSLYLATSPEVAGVSGRYFVACRPYPSAPASHDLEAAARLWRESAKLVGLLDEG